MLLAALLVHPAVPRIIRGHLPRSIDIRGFGYVAHTASYALLTLLLLVLVRPRQRLTAGLLVLGIAFHGMLTETVQYWVPARDCDPLDLLANLGGIALAAVVYSTILSRFLPETQGDVIPCALRTGKEC